jgi:hypothetical protein
MGTRISTVSIKVKPLELWWNNPFLSPDYWFVATHALTSYADLVTDVLSIVQFSTHGQQALMGLNLAFLLFNVCVDVALMPDWRGRLLSVLQLQQAVQAVETLSQGRQTESFVRSKKVDAVCRSVPSVVLQLYGLLLTLPSLGARGVLTIGLSVAVGVVAVLESVCGALVLLRVRAVDAAGVDEPAVRVARARGVCSAGGGFSRQAEAGLG